MLTAGTTMLSYTGSSVQEMLRMVEGGITTSMVDEVIKQYKIELQWIVRNYTFMGSPDGMSLPATDDLSSSSSSSTASQKKGAAETVLPRMFRQVNPQKCFACFVSLRVMCLIGTNSRALPNNNRVPPTTST